MGALSGIKDMVLNMLAPIVRKVAKDVLKAFLVRAFEKTPTEAHIIMLAVYPGVDVYLEDLVEKTDTELDNAVVAALMEAMEEVAAEEGFELPNLDDD